MPLATGNKCLSDRTRQRGILLALNFVTACVFLTGLGWGLPSRAVDPFLFGSVRPWTGAEVQWLAGDRQWDPDRGADVARNPIADRTQVVVLNETDRQRAEIVRRYRLYSYQPDEMTTLMSLAGMKPSRGDFDPKLYQYGGLYLYPIGAALKAASKVGLVDLKPDVAYYLDHPEAFGRFYVVARFTVAVWGILGVLVVFHLTQRLTGGLFAPTLAGLGYALMPVVVNMAHEAKPHLPGAVLMLFTVLIADTYVRSGRRRWGILAGAVAGAAAGMVVSSVLAFCVLPVMTLLRTKPWRERFIVTIAATMAGVAVYFMTNPYVAINLVRNRAVLQSNLGNSTKMYGGHGWVSGIPHAVALLAEGASPGVLVCGVAAVMMFILRARSRGVAGEGEVRANPSTVLLLLAVPASLQLIQFLVLAAGKPGEYGRFAILLDIALLIAAVAGLAHIVRGNRQRVIWLTLLIASVGCFGGRYLIGFIRDCRPETSRMIAAARIEANLTAGARSIAIWAEPAPYSLPPVNLFTCRLLLLPRGTQLNSNESPADLLIPPADALVLPITLSKDRYDQALVPPRSLPSPAISWADRQFCILRVASP